MVISNLIIDCIHGFSTVLYWNLGGYLVKKRQLWFGNKNSRKFREIFGKHTTQWKMWEPVARSHSYPSKTCAFFVCGVKLFGVRLFVYYSFMDCLYNQSSNPSTDKRSNIDEIIAAPAVLLLVMEPWEPKATPDSRLYLRVVSQAQKPRFQEIRDSRTRLHAT